MAFTLTASLPDEFAAWKKLESLNMASVRRWPVPTPSAGQHLLRFLQNGLVVVPPVVAKFSALKTLVLADNQVGEFGVQSPLSN